MIAVSTQEFNTSQEKYFDMALNGHVIIQRGKNLFIIQSFVSDDKLDEKWYFSYEETSVRTVNYTARYAILQTTIQLYNIWNEVYQDHRKWQITSHDYISDCSDGVIQGKVRSLTGWPDSIYPLCPMFRERRPTLLKRRWKFPDWGR